jgi:hypothetical protein
MRTAEGDAAIELPSAGLEESTSACAFATPGVTMKTAIAQSAARTNFRASGRRRCASR